jgi:hypothetical protein
VTESIETGPKASRSTSPAASCLVMHGVYAMAQVSTGLCEISAFKIRPKLARRSCTAGLQSCTACNLSAAQKTYASGASLPNSSELYAASLHMLLCAVYCLWPAACPWPCRSKVQSSPAALTTAPAACPADHVRCIPAAYRQPAWRHHPVCALPTGGGLHLLHEQPHIRSTVSRLEAL